MKAPQVEPRRILLIRPCCIGDVILATAVLMALRRAYPQAHIAWAVSSWARGVLEEHPMLDALHDTGTEALPVKSARGFARMTRIIRQQPPYDWVLSLVRSPLMSASVMLAHPPFSAGLHSQWRGFGYDMRVPVHPEEARHEAEIYLDIVRALGVDTTDCYAHIPVSETSHQRIIARLHEQNLGIRPFIVVNPTGGNNPGMQMASKRYPVSQLAHIADALADDLDADVIIIGGAEDGEHVHALQNALRHKSVTFVGTLTFSEIGALAQAGALYIGNDTGMTHLASASGAKTVMLMGPSDPRRYAPFNPNSIALWHDVALKEGGVAYADRAFDWLMDGITPDQALTQIHAFMGH